MSKTVRNCCYCNKSLFYYTILTIYALPVVSDIDFIAITGNICARSTIFPSLKAGNIVISKIVITGFCPIHFTITFAGQRLLIVIPGISLYRRSLIRGSTVIVNDGLFFLLQYFIGILKKFRIFTFYTFLWPWLY